MKRYGISILFFIVSVILFMTSAIVGSHLDANGMLIEPAFFCVPLGYYHLRSPFLPQYIVSPEISSTKNKQIKRPIGRFFSEISSYFFSITVNGTILSGM